MNLVSTTFNNLHILIHLINRLFVVGQDKASSTPMRTKLTDTELVQQFNAGDQFAFRKVFELFSPGLTMFSFKMINNKAEAEDITLMVFQNLFNKHHSFNTLINIKAFLYISSRNRCLNYIKHQHVLKKHHNEFAAMMSDDSCVEMEYNLKEPIIHQIIAEIDKLPKKCRTIFKMMYFDGLAPIEIAKQLNISRDTIATQRRRALNKLKLNLCPQNLK